MFTNTYTGSNHAARFIKNFACILVLLITVQATAQTTWTARQQGFALQAVTYTGSQFVSVGVNNTAGRFYGWSLVVESADRHERPTEWSSRIARLICGGCGSEWADHVQ